MEPSATVHSVYWEVIDNFEADEERIVCLVNYYKFSTSSTDDSLAIP